MSRNREILYSVRSPGWRIEASQTRRHDLFDNHAPAAQAARCLKLGGVTCNNLHQLDARLAFPLGISGSGKSSLVNQVLVKWVVRQLGLSARQRESRRTGGHGRRTEGCEITGGMEAIKRLVRLDQKAIGRAPC